MGVDSSDRAGSPDAETAAAQHDTEPGLESRVLLQRARARLLGRDDAPVEVGRYLVVGRIGAGAMGLVLRAYDPKLRREVALKVVRTRAGIDAEEAEGRLLREAQALAQLNHPNIVAIYDVEKADDGVCIAMEYVEGQSMRTWVDGGARRWSEVLPIALALAHGLAAAHAVGLVHRDVKPDNVLLGNDGRVRLTDFGLARAGPDSQSSWPPGSDAGADETLTRVGSVMGTPVYMAPEQHGGTIADAHTDQYALGVLIWEALYGERPFRGPGADALMKAKERGPPHAPTSAVPRWLHAVIARALAVRAEDRWPSVAAIADALASGQGRVRRRRALVVAAAIGMAGAGVLAVREIDERRTSAACADAGATIHTEVWNADTRARLEAAFTAGPSSARTTLTKVVDRAQWYADEWAAARTSVCEAAEIEHTLEPDLYAQAQECLDDQREGLAALLEVFAEGGSFTMQRATPAIYGLPAVETCTDPQALRRRPRAPESPELRAVSMELRRKLQRMKGLANAGRYEDSLVLGAEIEREAAESDLDALELEVVAYAGGVADYAGKYELGEKQLRRALVEAGELGLDDIAADAATRLIGLVGDSLARFGEGIAYADAAKVLVSRVEPDGQGPRHERLLHNLAGVYQVHGDAAEAERLYGEALAMSEAALGEEHPTVATQLGNLAGVMQARGALDEAEQMYVRTLSIAEATLGPDHPDVAVFLSNLAVVHMMRNEFAEAQPLLARALAIQEAALGAEHAAIAYTLTNLGATLHLLGRDEEAEPVLERAIAIREATVGLDHPTVATTLVHLASVNAARGRNDDAQRLAERSLAILEKAYGRDHTALARPLIELGEIELARGEPSDAMAPLERAMILLSPADARPDQRAEAGFLLAQALWSTQADRERALGLARAAADAYRDLGDAEREARLEVEAWLREREAP